VNKQGNSFFFSFERRSSWIPFCGILFGLLYLSAVLVSDVAAQKNNIFTLPQMVPFTDLNTKPPYLLADNNRTVHAFTAQSSKLGDAIYYTEWKIDSGWSIPIDIILAPLKGKARMVGAYLDSSGYIHLSFISGDETGAHIYYSKAIAQDANRSSAWSKPVIIGWNAFIFESADMVGDGEGNLYVIYSGLSRGPGVYYLYSNNNGDSWSTPDPVYSTNNDEMWPGNLNIKIGESGWIHAVWNVDNKSGQGRGIFYSRLDLQENQWSNTITLSETESGYGLKGPRVVEHKGILHVIYYLNGPFLLQQSDDFGLTWTTPVKPFVHTGYNGPPVFITDSSNELHLFWGQRISGRPDIHGIWHSIYRDNAWSIPEAVVAGPQIKDDLGSSSYDPFAPKAVCSQGNVLLVVWMTDPGLKQNGIWYSHKVLSSPMLPISPLSKPPSDQVNPVPPLTSYATSTPVVRVDFNSSDNNIDQADSPAAQIQSPFFYILIPASLSFGTIMLLLIFKFTLRKR
jgi:hypothetical protein